MPQNFNRPFIFRTNTTEIGFGAVLSQTIQGKKHPVIIISHKLFPAAMQLQKKDALTIKWAVLEPRYYFLG